MTALSAARYVRFRSRHSAGYMSLTSSEPDSFRKGWPTLTDWIHTFTGGPVPPSPLSSSTCSRLATSESRPSSRNWLYESTCGEKSDSRFACTSAELGSAFTPLKCRSGFPLVAGAMLARPSSAGRPFQVPKSREALFTADPHSAVDA
eukprot:scaffold106242_cov63-Phaeocystis_antarctica.AAC.7